MLIITGCGHSGTKFVSNLLDIAHEPRPRTDYPVMAPAWNNKELSRKYIKEIFTGEEREANSFLVPHIEAIRELFPYVNIFHLVRNPKKVVRSLISNDLYSGDGVSYHNIRLEVEGWDDLTQFQKTCWYWKIFNKRVRKSANHTIRLEDLLGEPVNRKDKSFPAYKDWTREQQQYFQKVCGPEMKYYGY